MVSGRPDWEEVNPSVGQLDFGPITEKHIFISEKISCTNPTNLFLYHRSK